jgi:hypothetical protein
MIAAVVLVAWTSVACFNKNQGGHVIKPDSRFEVATASVVLGARQLLVDTSNGDVWMLDGDRAPEAQWLLLARGPEDIRESEPVVQDVPAEEE